MKLSSIKKICIAFAIALPLGIAYLPPLAEAAETGGAGAAISEQVAAMSAYFALIIQALQNIIHPDNTENSPTPQLQSYFASLGNQYVLDSTSQNNANLLLELTAASYNVSTNQFTGKNPKIMNNLPQINDITYSSIVGLPPVQKGTVDPMQYIEAAGALNTPHTMPADNWQGSTQDQLQYIGFYNTVMSIESFNAYVLNNLVAENINGNRLTPLQTNLVSQASGSNFLAQVASETIGQVLRQSLMFIAQSYVLLTQMVQIERQQLTAQIMTNSMLVLGNQTNEGVLLMKAQGTQPGSSS